MRETIDIYSDGACSGNPGPGGAAALIVARNEMAAASSTGYRSTTNQRMEIAAATIGMTLAADYARRSGGTFRAVLHTDSQYVVATLTKGWKRKANLDLWQGLDSAIAELTSVLGPNSITVEWVKGHAGNVWNNQADRLAVEAAHNPQHDDDGYVRDEMPDLFSASAEPAAAAAPQPDTAPKQQDDTSVTVTTTASRRLGIEYFTADGIRYMLVTGADGAVLGITRA